MKSSTVTFISRVKTLVVALTGFTALAIGIAMIVLPGPAVVVIPIGLGILATEFIWAKRLLQRVKEHIEYLKTEKTVPITGRESHATLGLSISAPGPKGKSVKNGTTVI